jgi:DNA helicase-2/ATP-dependent DNA helicase PcrA
MIELKAKLNPSQLEAVTTVGGAVLVIAGAGSGKTRVIEYRVLNLVQNNIDPASILLLTFTREASRRMLERATTHDVRCKHVEGGTFHSFGYKILKRYAKRIGFPESFSILDESDSKEALHRCAASLGLLDKEKRFPKKDTLRAILSGSLNKNIAIEKILEKEYPDFLLYASDIEKISKSYAEYKIQKNLFDYDDLLVFTKLLLEDTAVRETFSSRYRFIMVDEYQDTNKLQADIAYLLASGHNNIMAVGDDAQSIYGFRGAFHKNIMDFPKRFKECKIIKLEENYRSTQSILNLANSVLENMENKYSKCLVSARKVSGEKPQIWFFTNAYMEAEWMAEKIKELKDEGVPFSQQAVLFRSSYISIPLQAELSKRNIPFQVFGGLRFYETAHVKDLMSHLKVLINPKDELSWSRILMLLEGVGPKTSDKILKEIACHATLGNIIEKSLQPYYNKYKFSAQLSKLRDAIKAVSAENSSISGQFGIMLDYYLPVLKEKFDDWNLRLNDLETLRQIASRYESLVDLLADFAIESPEAGVEAAEPASCEYEKPLTLSTIHSAKGLEWGHVFLLGLMEGIFPVSFSLNDAQEIEEEHRLFYVAVTRAQNNLLLSFHHEATRSGMHQFNKISRFVDTENILSNLEKQAFVEPDIDGGELFGGDDEDTPNIYDRRFLST